MDNIICDLNCNNNMEVTLEKGLLKLEITNNSYDFEDISIANIYLSKESTLELIHGLIDLLGDIKYIEKSPVIIDEDE